MQALTEIKPGESCTVKWMVTGARIAEWMEKHSITEGILPQLSVFAFLYYRTYSIINISKNMGEAVRCQVHTVHYV